MISIETLILIHVKVWALRIWIRFDIVIDEYSLAETNVHQLKIKNDVRDRKGE